MIAAVTLLFALSGIPQELVVEIPAPQYRIVGNRLIAEETDFIDTFGAPRLPCTEITLALPPGARLESVDFHGERTMEGRVDIAATEPARPLDGRSLAPFEGVRQQYYGTDSLFPSGLGAVLAKGGLRQYPVVRIACHHFAYQPLSKALLVAPKIEVTVRYSLPRHENSKRSLIGDHTFDPFAAEIIYNWEDTRRWFRSENSREAMGYHIILPAALTDAVSALAAYRAEQGYNVFVITREYIEAHFTGVDVQEKIRNYLRQQMPDIRFALLVGNFNDMPWRMLVPFNNDPDSPYQDPNTSPIPGDIYYADLTDPDHLSWNSDGDDYYGEVYDESFAFNPDDDPDYFPDIHVGRIPFSSAGAIEEICTKTIAFDSNRDSSYKTASLLTGSIYYFENENGEDGFRLDGADFMEELMNDSVFDRAKADYLYEVDGLNPSLHPCTTPLTRNNHITSWQRKGIMYECHHGNPTIYARKIWAWDDGDGVPENNEIQWPISFQTTDVYQVDNAYPATSFLRSCLCGKPEETSLGAMMLYRGASAVVCSSRIAWLSLADLGGLPYHFYNRLLKKAPTSQGVVGTAHDLARIDYMDATSFWIIIYHYNLFGDPALRQFGRVIEYEEYPVPASTLPHQ